MIIYDKYRSVQSRRGSTMEATICNQLGITQTASRGPNACSYDGVDQDGRRVEIKTINARRLDGIIVAARMREKRGLCDRLVLEYKGRLFDTTMHSDPKKAMDVLLTQRTAFFNPGLEDNGKSTQQNLNTKVLLECERV